jgi:hypothetical protein
MLRSAVVMMRSSAEMVMTASQGSARAALG